MINFRVLGREIAVRVMNILIAVELLVVFCVFNDYEQMVKDWKE